MTLKTVEEVVEIIISGDNDECSKTMQVIQEYTIKCPSSYLWQILRRLSHVLATTKTLYVGILYRLQCFAECISNKDVLSNIDVILCSEFPLDEDDDKNINKLLPIGLSINLIHPRVSDFMVDFICLLIRKSEIFAGRVHICLIEHIVSIICHVSDNNIFTEEQRNNTFNNCKHNLQKFMQYIHPFWSAQDTIFENNQGQIEYNININKNKYANGWSELIRRIKVIFDDYFDDNFNINKLYVHSIISLLNNEIFEMLPSLCNITLSEWSKNYNSNVNSKAILWQGPLADEFYKILCSNIIKNCVSKMCQIAKESVLEEAEENNNNNNNLLNDENATDTIITRVNKDSTFQLCKWEYCLISFVLSSSPPSSSSSSASSSSSSSLQSKKYDYFPKQIYNIFQLLWQPIQSCLENDHFPDGHAHILFELLINAHEYISKLNECQDLKKHHLLYDDINPIEPVPSSVLAYLVLFLDESQFRIICNWDKWKYYIAEKHLIDKTLSTGWNTIRVVLLLLQHECFHINKDIEKRVLINLNIMFQNSNNMGLYNSSMCVIGFGLLYKSADYGKDAFKSGSLGSLLPLAPEAIRNSILYFILQNTKNTELFYLVKFIVDIAVGTGIKHKFLSEEHVSYSTTWTVQKCLDAWLQCWTENKKQGSEKVMFDSLLDRCLSVHGKIAWTLTRTTVNSSQIPKHKKKDENKTNINNKKIINIKSNTRVQIGAIMQLVDAFCVDFMWVYSRYNDMKTGTPPSRFSVEKVSRLRYYQGINCLDTIFLQLLDAKVRWKVYESSIIQDDYISSVISSSSFLTSTIVKMDKKEKRKREYNKPFINKSVETCIEVFTDRGLPHYLQAMLISEIAFIKPINPSFVNLVRFRMQKYIYK